MGDEANLMLPRVGKLSGATAPVRQSPARGTASPDAVNTWCIPFAPNM